MRKFIAALALVVSATVGALAAFSMVQVGGPISQITCNPITGAATGATGPCTSPLATCDGVANDSSAFVSFNTWAKANQGSGSSLKQVVLNVPNGASCYFKTGGFATNGPGRGITNLLVSGYGATFKADNTNPNSAFDLGASNVGICHNAITDAGGCSARLQTVSSGATSVTLTAASLGSGYASRFVVGRWMVVTGFDMMGTWGIAFGYPPNPFYYNYVQITAVNAGTGVITFTPALTHDYKSTWPLFSAGLTASEADQGGPATAYALDANWDATTEYQGLTLDQTQYQTLAIGRTVTYRDVTVTGTNCIVPSQNMVFNAIRVTMSSCSIEMDKLNGVVTYDNSTASRFQTQSASVDELIIKNSSTVNTITGTPKKATFSDSTFGAMSFGPSAFGRGDEVVCTNCAISGAIGFGGFTETGDQYSSNGFNKMYTMSGGVIKFPNGTTVSACADNGSGQTRVTVVSSTGFFVGNGVAISGVWSGANLNVPTTITAIPDATHIDFATSPATCIGTGTLAHSAPRWAVPGTNLLWKGALAAEALAFQVTDVTQDAASVCASGPCYTYITTTLAGGFPSLPLTSGALNVTVHPSPKFTCTNCTGSADAASFVGMTATNPLWSYSKRTFTGDSTFSNYTIFGNPISINYNVTTAYTAGLTPKLSWNILGVNSAGAQFNYNAFIDLKTTGSRTVTLGAIAPCGALGTDSGLCLPDATLSYLGGLLVPSISPNVSGSSPLPSVTITATTNQGVVIP